MARRRACYLGTRSPVPVTGRTAIVVDDGIATGTSMRAALRAVRARRPARLVLSVPLAPARVVAELTPEVDDLVCLETRQPFHAVGAHYALFAQVSDHEVVAAMAGPCHRQQQRQTAGTPMPKPPASLPAFRGHLVMVGCGAVGQATLPVLLRDGPLSPRQVTVIDPQQAACAYARKAEVEVPCQGITADNLNTLLA